MIIKIKPDKERSKSILKMAESTESAIKKLIKAIGIKEGQNIIVREYYEIIRELATAILLSNGFKAIGNYAHKETINHLSKYKEFNKEDILEIQNLRIKRNKNSYEGKPIKSPYLENKKEKLNLIIKKLKKILKNNF